MSKFLQILAKILAFIGLVLIALALYNTAVAAREAAEAMAQPTPTPVPAATAAPTPTPTPEPTPEPTPTPTPEPTPQIYTVSMVGDCTLSSYPEIRNYPTSFENVVKEDWAYPFSNTAEYFKNDDFTLANLECIFSDEPGWSSSTFAFKAPSAAVNILTEGGVDYVTTANNHSLDFGQEKYEASNAILDAAGIGNTGEAECAIFTTDSGLTVGVYSVFNYYAPSVEDMTNNITNMRSNGAEVVIVAVHWGIEGQYYPTGDQERVGRAAIDAGADIVYGSHPHRLQPVEQYNGGLIFYSMANWCFGGNTNPSDKDTAIAQVRFQRELDGTFHYLDYILIPCSISSVPDANDYCPTPYEPGSADYDRALSKIDGSYSGPNSTIDYSFMHQNQEG